MQNAPNPFPSGLFVIRPPHAALRLALLVLAGTVQAALADPSWKIEIVVTAAQG